MWEQLPAATFTKADTSRSPRPTSLLMPIKDAFSEHKKEDKMNKQPTPEEARCRQLDCMVAVACKNTKWSIKKRALFFQQPNVNAN